MKHIGLIISIKLKVSDFLTYLSCNPGQIAQFSCWHTDKELSSKSSHLERVKVAQFVYQVIFRVLRGFADIIFTYTHYHTSYTQFYTKNFHLNYKITPFFALFFMLFHTRPLLRVYVFVNPFYFQWYRQTSLVTTCMEIGDENRIYCGLPTHLLVFIFFYTKK